METEQDSKSKSTTSADTLVVGVKCKLHDMLGMLKAIHTKEDGSSVYIFHDDASGKESVLSTLQNLKAVEIQDVAPVDVDIYHDGFHCECDFRGKWYEGVILNKSNGMYNFIFDCDQQKFLVPASMAQYKFRKIAPQHIYGTLLLPSDIGNVQIIGTHGIFYMKELEVSYKFEQNQNLQLSFIPKSSLQAEEKVFEARYQQLKAATANSEQALKDIEVDSEASVGDVGMIYLEHVKLRGELQKMQTMQQLECDQLTYNITLKPGEGCNMEENIGPMCWLPTTFKQTPKNEAKKQKCVVSVNFKKSLENVTFSKISK